MKVLDYMKPMRLRMVGGFVVKVIGTVLDLMIPWVLSYILDYVVKENSIAKIIIWGSLMVVLSILCMVFNVTANRMAAKVARDTINKVRTDLFRKIGTLSSRQIDNFTIPSLEARVTSDTYEINNTINMAQRIGVRAPILLIGGIAVTMTFEPRLSVIILALLPIQTLVITLLYRKGFPMWRAVQKGGDDMGRAVRETVSGIRVIKALSREDDERESFKKEVGQLSEKTLRANLAMAKVGPLMNIILNVGLVLVIIRGAYLVNEGESTPGTIIAFLSYFNIILNAMMLLTRIFIMFSRTGVCVDRVEEVLNAPLELEAIPEEKRKEEDYIVFDHVSFSYMGRKNNLSNISFSLKKGQTLGIIGAIGSGKTTVINLLQRLYEKDSGSIRIKGEEVSSIEPERLHTMFGVVFQNDVVFQDTIRNNIDFGRNLPKEVIVRAAKDAQAYNFIKDLPDGFEHELSQRGTNLSGGQKQRLLIARALAGRPEILILDDSSSALDYKTDAELRKALRENYPETTTIVIAQRVSSILHADHILVLEDGEEIGYGKHDELMASNAVYREIGESQLGGDFEL